MYSPSSVTSPSTLKKLLTERVLSSLAAPIVKVAFSSVAAVSAGLTRSLIVARPIEFVWVSPSVNSGIYNNEWNPAPSGSS